jgi:hypothetical protein
VIVEVGHAGGSYKLAMEFVNTALSRWGGILDDDHGGIYTREDAKYLDIEEAIRRSIDPTGT